MFWVFMAVGFGLMGLAHTAPFPFLLDAMAPATAVWSMPKNAAAPTIYLTFDDGPNPTATPDLLDVLADEQALATFFLIDRHVTDDTAPIVRRIFDEGHAVGLHTHTRKLMVMSPHAVAETLAAAADRIELVAGQRPCPAFRPHGGWRSGQLYAGLAEIDYTLIGWGWGLWDFNWYRRQDPQALVKNLDRRVSDGDIIVIHDGHHKDPRADRQYAVDATAMLIPALRARGFRFGRICG